MFKSVWNKYTVTTILIVPVLDETMPVVQDLVSNLKYPFLQIAFDAGLENGYLGIRNTLQVQPGFGKQLFLMFDKKTCLKEWNVTSPYFSMNEMIIDSSPFDAVFLTTSQYIVYRINLPEYWEEDYRKITEGKYSGVSKGYKESIRTKQVRIPKSESYLTNFILVANLAFKVTCQSEDLRDSVERFLGNKIPKDMELFKKFRKKNEILDLDSLT